MPENHGFTSMCRIESPICFQDYVILKIRSARSKNRLAEFLTNTPFLVICPSLATTVTCLLHIIGGEKSQCRLRRDYLHFDAVILYTNPRS